MPYQTLHSEYLHKDFPLMTLRKDRLLLPNSQIIDPYYVLEYPAWVTVLAINKAQQFVVIKQYRHGLGLESYELPAGMVDPGDAGLVEAAQRELLEETGYGGGHWQEWLTVCANPSTHNNLCHCFLATEVEPIAPQNLERTEIITVELMNRSELKARLSNNEILQSLHTSALWKYFAETAMERPNHRG